jgi:hypothetical protein
MAEPTERRSNRSIKPKVHFDDRIAQSGPSKPSVAPDALAKPIKPASKSTKTPTSAAKSTAKPKAKPKAKPTAKLPKSTTSTKPSATEPTNLDPVQELCSQTEGLEITNEKAKKKAKADEIVRLTALDLKSIMEEAKPPKEVQFKPLNLGDHRDPKANIPSNIDATDPLVLLDLFIPPEMYTTIAENTNLYAISKDAPTNPTKTNSRYWFPTNKDEIRVLFGILYYMGVHREP